MLTTPGHDESRIDMDISQSKGLHQDTCLATPVHILPALYFAFDVTACQEMQQPSSIGSMYKS